MTNLATQFTRIFTLTGKDVKPLYGIMNHLTSEVGELAEAVEVHEGHRKKQLSEPLVGEVADVIQCALSVFARATPWLSTDAQLALIVEYLAKKTDKWEATLPKTEQAPVPTATTPAPSAAVWPFDTPSVSQATPAAPKNLAQSLGLKPSTPKKTVTANDVVRNDIISRVKRITSEQLGITHSDVKLSSYFVSDLGADSLDTIELVMAIEDEFGIEIDDADAEAARCVNDAVEYLYGLLVSNVRSIPPATETGRLYVNIRKHPDGVYQPVGKRKVTRLEVAGDLIKIGIGDGTQGWTFSTTRPAPTFLDFIIDTDKGKRVTLAEAISYWNRHNP